MHAKDVEAMWNPLSMARLVGPETLEELGWSIARQHRPVTFDWAARFGIGPEGSDTGVEGPAMAMASATPSQDVAPSAAPPPRSGSIANKAPPICAVCGGEVDSKVAFFCKINKVRFSGRVLCREHQAGL